MKRTALAALAVPALLAPLAFVAPAHADGDDKEREFRVAGSEVEFQVEKERKGFDVDVDVDDARPGSKWRIVLRHEGKVYSNRVYRADRDGDIDIDTFRRDTAGSDTFSVTVRRVGGEAKTAKIHFKR